MIKVTKSHPLPHSSFQIELQVYFFSKQKPHTNNIYIYQIYVWENSRMSNGIELQKMVFTAITSNLELGSKPNGCTGLLCHGYGLLDLLQVAIEIHGPLVQITRGHLQQPHLLSLKNSNQTKIIIPKIETFCCLQTVWLVMKGFVNEFCWIYI